MWKDIPGWEDLYQVNDKGEVRNKIYGNLLAGDVNNAGYYRVCLYDKPRKQRWFRHRLVATLFLDNPKSLEEVNHIDKDKSNNSVQNLEWVSRIENEHKNHFSNSKKYTPFAVDFQNGEHKEYDFAPQLAEELNVTPPLIKQWLRGHHASYKKYGIKNIYYIVKA